LGVSEGAETREQRMARLSAKARSLPAVPGVYLMKDARDRVIYVGKASRLPDRVGSYFAASTDLGPKKQPMLEQVRDFDVLECETEWEALLAENRLIKDLKPRFNVRLTDDKTFPYLVITRNEDFPRVLVTRNPRGLREDGTVAPEMRNARVFGPFTNAGALREAVQILQRVFRFRTCSLDIVAGDERNRAFRPCLLHSIGQCTAPCADRIGVQAYREDVERFARFLAGSRGAMLRELEQEMRSAAAGLEFEKAARLRDQLRAIQRLGERATLGQGWQPETEVGLIDPRRGLAALQKTLGLDAPIRCIEGIDIAHLQGGETVGSKVCFVDGRPLKAEYRRYRIRGVGPGIHNDDYAAIREVVGRRYREAGAGHELYPDVILVDGGLGQLHAALEVFDTLDLKPPMVIALAKKEEVIYIQRRREPVRLGRDNPGLRLCQAIRDEAHRFAQSYHHLLRRKKTLGEE
jgi:excinuclease ABC subunit C